MEELYEPIIFFSPTVTTETNTDLENAAKKSEDNGFNLNFFFSDDAVVKPDKEEINRQLEEDKKKAAKPKKIPKSAGPADAKQNTQINSDITQPYINSYQTTNDMLHAAIAQSDTLSAEIKADIDSIRSSKTLKGKYTYLTNLNTTVASLLSAKLQAIRELDSNITQSHNLELKRAKDLKEADESKRNDDARMMDLYSAFINAPMGMYDNKLNMPTMPEMMLGVNDQGSGIRGVSMNQTPYNGGGNITPEQARMRMESNSNIEEIVVFDPSTGQKWFDVIDISTGASIPNYPRSDGFLLEDTSIDTRARIAKNRNLDRVWPLHIVGNVDISDY